MPKYKTIFSLKIRAWLASKGIYPLFEADNREKPGYKCWIYETTDNFTSLLEEYFVSEGGRANG